jgi:3-hydroxyisobutyrate dehydrogenase-like beta-hydroxyacid dehydrogenase
MEQRKAKGTAMVEGSQNRIGWLGVGRMGSVLAGGLLRAGYDMTVWNRTQSKAEPLVADGAHLATSISDLRELDIVFTTVSTPQDLLEVTLGDDGLLVGEAAPAVLVDCSTVSVEVSAKVRAAAVERNVEFLACGMSGNHIAVEQGKACFVASGPESAFKVVEPLLRVLGREVVYAGANEQSRLVKLAYNLFLAVMTEGLAEVIGFVEQCDIDRDKFLAFFNQTHLSSPWIQNRTPAMVAHDWTPTFTCSLLRKDVRLGVAEAHKRDAPIPAIALIGELLEAAINRGYGPQDILALTDLYRSEAT